MSNLYLRASYDLPFGVGLYVQAANLLDKQYQRFEGYPAEGLSLLGGLTFRF